MSQQRQAPVPVPNPYAPGQTSPTGTWYFFVTILSGGMLAWVPMVHAASRLHHAYLWRRALGYALVAMIVFLISNGPTPGLALTVSIVFMIIACVQLGGVRRQVYPPLASAWNLRDPSAMAVARVQAARSARSRARDLVASDPLMAHELRIGRPDLPRGYDDGGLVDVNSAPAHVIAGVCGVSPAVAGALCHAREQAGAFGSVTEALVAAGIDGPEADLITEHGVTLPYRSWC